MHISRAKFLRSLGSSVAGMALGTGLVSAAESALKAVASATPATPTPPLLTGEEVKNVHFIGSSNGFGNRISITFDDGPTPGVTEVVLDELKKRNIRSTFFMIGKRVAAAPELAQRVLAEGHEICNHTYNHLKLNSLPPDRVDWELKQTQEKIEDVTQHTPLWLRPPFGAFRKDQISIPQANQLGVVFWDVDPRDWSQPGEEKIVNTILTETRPGSIVLCHDLHQQTANCIGRVLDGLLEKDYEFINISAFLGLPKFGPAVVKA